MGKFFADMALTLYRKKFRNLGHLHPDKGGSAEDVEKFKEAVNHRDTLHQIWQVYVGTAYAD